MAKMVGLSRNLKLAWLNQAVILVSSDLTENEIPEKYHISKHKVAKDEISGFMVYTMMNVDDSGYHSFRS